MNAFNSLGGSFGAILLIFCNISLIVIVRRMNNQFIAKNCFNQKNAKDMFITLGDCNLSNAYIFSTVFSISFSLYIYEKPKFQMVFECLNNNFQSVICIVSILIANFIGTILTGVIINTNHRKYKSKGIFDNIVNYIKKFFPKY